MVRKAVSDSRLVCPIKVGLSVGGKDFVEPLPVIRGEGKHFLPFFA